MTVEPSVALVPHQMKPPVSCSKQQLCVRGAGGWKDTDDIPLGVDFLANRETAIEVRDGVRPLALVRTKRAISHAAAFRAMAGLSDEGRALGRRCRMVFRGDSSGSASDGSVRAGAVMP